MGKSLVQRRLFDASFEENEIVKGSIAFLRILHIFCTTRWNLFSAIATAYDICLCICKRASKVI